jgi:rhomboid protease GluP
LELFHDFPPSAAGRHFPSRAFLVEQRGAGMTSSDAGNAKANLPIITILLLAANVGTYLVDIYFGMDWLKPETDTLVALGANFAPLTLTGESWRLFSSMFMHGNIQHLAINMYMLAIIGIVAERSFGRLPFLVIYLASGAAGSLCSAVWSGHHEISGVQMIGSMILHTSGLRPVVSVGASGALMGIAGACLAARAIENVMVDMSNHVLEGTGKSIAQVIGINLVLGLVMTGIDQAAHIGGLLAGATVGGALFAFGRKGPVWQVTLSVAAGIVTLVGATVLAGRAGSDELRELRTQVEAEAREKADALAKQRRRKAIEEMAAEDSRNMPAPVSAEEAAGVEIDLQGKGAGAFALSPSGKRLYVTFLTTTW